MDYSICFCVCIRNVSSEIIQVLKNINDISSKTTGPNHLIIYTNDNTDNTLEVISNFEFDFPDDYHIISEIGVHKDFKNDAIARGRNLLIEKANTISDWDYLCMLDGDSLNHKITGFFETLELMEKNSEIPHEIRPYVIKTHKLPAVDFVSAYQIPYFDYWTLITDHWDHNIRDYGWEDPQINSDGQLEINPNLGIPSTRSLSYSDYTFVKRFKGMHINDILKTDLHPVVSAFGGLGIFKRHVIEYAIKHSIKFDTEGSTNCEIVPFLKKLPFKKYICTILQNGRWPGLPV